MDLITVDLTEHTTAAIGDSVELWGAHVSIDQVAELSGTIGYELMAGVTARVPRVVVE
jgi:alanine racemase